MDMGTATIAGTSSAGAFPRRLVHAQVVNAEISGYYLLSGDPQTALTDYAIGYTDHSLNDPFRYTADAVYCGPY